MNLGALFLGVNPKLLDQLPEDLALKQSRLFHLLGAMMLVISMLSAFSGAIYGLVLFNDDRIAACCAVFLGLIGFIIVQMLLFSSLQTGFNKLKNQLSNMDTLYANFTQQDMRGISDEQALELVTQQKQVLRTEIDNTPSNSNFSRIIIVSFVVSVLLGWSFLISTAYQFFVFKDQLNHSFNSIMKNPQVNRLANSYQTAELNDPFYAQKLEAIGIMKMLKKDKAKPFRLLHCHSVLFSYKVLAKGIGNHRLWINFLMAIILLLPFFFVKKSIEIQRGLLLKEVVIESIGASLLMFLLSLRETQQCKDRIENQFDFNKLLD